MCVSGSVRGTVTISASYGAGGARVGTEVARQLGLDFFDRAIPVAVAQRLAVTAEEAQEHDERPPGLVDRLLGALANVAVPVGPEPSRDAELTRSGYCASTEAVLRDIADGAGGVVLGRAAMIVLGQRSDVLSVRLDGPVEARIAQARRLQGLDDESARAELHTVDRARQAYVHVFYGKSQHDPSLYHLVVDSTSISLGAVADIVVAAARDRLSAHPAPHEESR
jgi:cytidylate kinase